MSIWNEGWKNNSELFYWLFYVMPYCCLVNMFQFAKLYELLLSFNDNKMKMTRNLGKQQKENLVRSTGECKI